jgi:hypothetical protein
LFLYVVPLFVAAILSILFIGYSPAFGETNHDCHHQCLLLIVSLSSLGDRLLLLLLLQQAIQQTFDQQSRCNTDRAD